MLLGTTGTNADILSADIQNGPLAPQCKPLVAMGSDDGVAKLFNATAGVGAGPVNRSNITRGELLEVFTGNGSLASIYALASDTNNPAYSVSKATTLILADPLGSVDYTRPGTKTLVGAMGSSGFKILTDSQLNELIAICTRIGSRAEVLFGEGVILTSADVAKALRG